jgi:glucose/arabinose dehydrogenase
MLVGSVGCIPKGIRFAARHNRCFVPGMRFLVAPLVPLLLLSSLISPARAAEPVGAAGDAVRGKALFQHCCVICLATGQGDRPQAGQGPSLAGVVGRPAAALSNFGYTKALAASHLVWDAATLDKFLASPPSVVPGTAMVIPTANPNDRSDLIAFLATLKATAPAVEQPAKPHPRTNGDWENDAPGKTHRINLAQLPAPYATESAGNSPKTVDRPAGANPVVPAGFQVKLFASELSGPRLMRTAPNGDIFVAETRQGRIRVLRTAEGADTPAENSVFAEGLSGPFGIAFYPVEGEPKWIYIANMNSVIRFPYHNGDLRVTGTAEIVVPQLTDSGGGHSTRDIVFSPDGRRLFISVGSASNVAEKQPEKTTAEIREWEAATAKGAMWGNEIHRADVLVCDPEGHNLKIFATGIRNAVTVTVQPGSGKVWVSTNERDGLGDDLVSDYISSVQEGGFYGWPWYYLGNHEDPRHAGKRPDLAGQAIVPDVPLQAHSASLQMTFYPATVSGKSAFPKQYRGEIFAALHGSWNRTGRTGSKVIRVKLKHGVATGEYEDFLTGFVVDDGHVWGRPVGVTVAKDGALLVSDDANGTIWRVTPKQ